MAYETEDETYSGQRQPYAPYQQSRSALRRRFGARAIDGSAPPSQRNRPTMAANIGVMGGSTDDNKWAGFFRPVRRETSMFSAGTMGATGATPLGNQAPIAPLFGGVPAQDELPQAAAVPTMVNVPPPIPASPAAVSAPVDYLKEAHARSTAWMNAQSPSDYLRSATGSGATFSGGILGKPIQAGLSFTGGRYQTPRTVGRVDSGNLLARKRAMDRRLLESA